MFAPGGGQRVTLLLAMATWAALLSPARADDDAVEAPPGASVAVEAGEIVVEAEPLDPSSPLVAAGSVTVLMVDAGVSASTDVATLVDGAAGTTVVQLGGLGDFSAVSLRGSTFRQVQVHLDGVPLNPDGGDTVNMSELPLAAFSRVEVWRSAAPPEMLASPIGGVINLVTGDGAAEPWVGATVGSFGTARVTGFGAGAGAWLGQPADGLAVVDLFRTRGDFGYFADQGTVYHLLDDRRTQRGNNDKSQLSAHGRVRVGGDRLRLTALDAFLSRDEGLPGHANDPAVAARLASTRNLAVAQIDGGGAASRGWGRLWALQRREVLDDRAGEVGIASQWLRTDTDSFGLAGHGRWGLAPQAVPALTGSARLDRVQIDDLDASAVPPTRRRVALSGAASADFILWKDRLVISPVVQGQGLRYLADDAQSEGVLGGSGAGTADVWSADPRLGLRLSPWPLLALKATAGRYLRAPDFTELFGDRGALVGNPDLRPERGWQWDVGTAVRTPEAAWGRVSGELSGFWRQSTDLIAWSQNSQRTLIPVNVGRARVQGVEAALAVELLGAIDVDVSLTQTTTENQGERRAVAGNELPRVPPWEAYIGSSLHHEEWVRVGHGWSATAPTFWDATNYYQAPRRSFHNVFARVGLHPAVRLELECRNLLNTTVEVVDRDPLDDRSDARRVQAVTDFVGYPLPGRTFLFTLRFTG